MKYHFFLDETGDHGLSCVDKNFPIFLLCGCLFREDRLDRLEGRINAFKQKYFKTESVVLHSREIRKCEGAFQILFDVGLKATFYEDLNLILKEEEYSIIGAAVNKEEHIKSTTNHQHSIYNILLFYGLIKIPITPLRKR
ncbi:MAG: DUF3800 domain-containing protein [Thermodesulfobacteriota bacterium]